MRYLTSGLENIVNGEGIGIAITGLSIVFVALALITLFIAALPQMLTRLENVLPPEIEHHAAPPAAPLDDEPLAVAVGFALHMKAKDQP